MDVRAAGALLGLGLQGGEAESLAAPVRRDRRGGGALAQGPSLGPAAGAGEGGGGPADSLGHSRAAGAEQVQRQGRSAVRGGRSGVAAVGHDVRRDGGAAVGGGGGSIAVG